MIELRPYQQLGAFFLARRQFALLADEMRLGKTPQAIRAAAMVDAKSMLVVCPAIAVPQWRSEITRWWTGHHHPHAVVRSYDRAKMEAKELLAEKWDVAIIDEAHFAKNPEAQRTKLVYGKGGIGWASKRLWALSGTPAPKHAAELWPMLRAFGVVGLSYNDFIHRYCYCIPKTDTPIGTKVSMIPELKQLLARVMLRRKRKEVAPDMPDIGYSFLNIEGDAPEAALCERCTGMSGIPYGLNDDALALWLEQNATRYPKDDRIAVAMAKLPRLGAEVQFALDNDLYRKTVVFGWHREPLISLTHMLRNHQVKAELLLGGQQESVRTAICEDFQRGGTQVVVAQILAAGTAIDLSAASHGYALELDWVPGNNVQAANRMISMDKDEKVTLDVVTWPGSTDERVHKALLRRTQELSKLY